MKLLWLDDIRNPREDNWLVFSPIEQPFEVIWVKSYAEFVSWISQNGLPDAICFDHDLGLDVKISLREKGFSKKKSRRMYKEMNEKNGYDCAKWLIEYCIDTNLPLPKYNIQSANPVGKANIDGILKSYSKFQDIKEEPICVQTGITCGYPCWHKCPRYEEKYGK